MDFIQQVDADVLLAVKAVPGASRDQIAGPLGDRLKIKTAAPPEGGKANKAICQLLAQKLGVPKNRITIDSGHANAEKIIRIRSTTAADIHRKITDAP